MTRAEALFLAFLHLGAFEIDAKGQIWRRWWCATGQRTRVPVIPPERAERDLGDGYLKISFQWDDEQHLVMAHRIVYMDRRREILPDEIEVNHRNGIRADNRPENLEAMTRLENIRHSIEVLRSRRGTRGEGHHAAKLSWGAVLECRTAVAEGLSTQKGLCLKYGVSPATMSQAVNGKTWKHVE